MPFYQGQDFTKLSEEVSRLELLTAKAIKGEMNTEDFQSLRSLFEGVGKAQYNGYIKSLLPNLSDENLHKLVAGLVEQTVAPGLAANTFLRDNNILKGLMIAEARRHGLEVTYPPLTVPETIPDAILDHYKMLMEKGYANVFNGSKGQETADMRTGNVRANIKFNILNTLVLEATNEASPADRAAIMQKLASPEGPAAMLYTDIDSKVIAGKKESEVQVQVEPLGLADTAAKKSSPEEITALAQKAAVECSGNLKYKTLPALQALDKAVTGAVEDVHHATTRDGIAKAQKELTSLLKQHNSLRKSAGISYELGEGSKIYKLLMSGNEQTIAKLVEKMLPNGLMGGSAINLEALEKNSPPELLLKMIEIAQKVEDRKGGKVSGFKDGLNKFANGMKRAFSLGSAGIRDKDIQGAVQELEAVSKKFAAEKAGQSQSIDSVPTTLVTAPFIAPSMDLSSSTKKSSTFVDKLNYTAKTPAFVREMHEALLAEIVKVRRLEPHKIGSEDIANTRAMAKDFCTNFCFGLSKDILGKELVLGKQRKVFEAKFEGIFKQMGQEVDQMIKIVAKKHGVSMSDVFMDERLIEELIKSIGNAQKQKKLSGYKELTDICSDLIQVSKAKPTTFTERARSSQEVTTDVMKEFLASSQAQFIFEFSDYAGGKVVTRIPKKKDIETDSRIYADSILDRLEKDTGKSLTGTQKEEFYTRLNKAYIKLSSEISANLTPLLQNPKTSVDELANEAASHTSFNRAAEELQKDKEPKLEKGSAAAVFKDAVSYAVACTQQKTHAAKFSERMGQFISR